jgi:hypothetical protein
MRSVGNFLQKPAHISDFLTVFLPDPAQDLVSDSTDRTFPACPYRFRITRPSRMKTSQELKTGHATLPSAGRISLSDSVDARHIQRPVLPERFK